MAKNMQLIRTRIIFQKEAEEAVNLYVSLFSSVFTSAGGESKILKTTFYREEDLKGLLEEWKVTRDTLPGREGFFVDRIYYQLQSQEFIAENGGIYFGRFPLSISLCVSCDTQEQIDQLWEKLAQGGEEMGGGWLMDKFGVIWQIIPSLIDKIEEEDPEKFARVMDTIMDMRKIDIEKVRRA